MEIRWLCSVIVILTSSIFVQATQAQTNLNNKWKALDDHQEPKKFNIDLSNDHKDEHVEKLPVDSDHQEIPGKSNEPHSRKKRLIWVTEDGRLALPPGTAMTITPTLALPLVRYPPDGFLSNITISLPLTIDFDKLGLTDNENPLGVLPPLLARSMGSTFGSYLAHYIGEYMKIRRKRSTPEEDLKPRPFVVKQERVEDQLPQLKEDFKHAFHGGERAILYGVVEDFLSTFGMDGKACLLRTICEVHSKSVHHLGLFGEMLQLFLSATRSPFFEHLPEYVAAEEVGKGTLGPGECFPYYKECPKSLFKSAVNMYADSHKNVNDLENDVDHMSM